MRVWRNCEVKIKGKNRSTSVKNEKEQCLWSPFIFNSIHHKMKSKHPSYYQMLCNFTGIRFSHSYGHSKISNSTGHRLLCWIFGACLMAIYKVRFWWHCKMAGKVMCRAKRGEGHSITFCTVFYLALPCRLLPPCNWTEYTDSSICPKRPVLSQVQTISEKETSVTDSMLMLG